MTRTVKLYGTTDTSGNLVLTSAAQVSGEVVQVEWIDGTLADGVDAVLSVVRNDDASDITILTLTNANVDKVYFPRFVVHDTSGADLTIDGTHPLVGCLTAVGQLRLSISSGGNAKSGGAIVYLD